MSLSGRERREGVKRGLDALFIKKSADYISTEKGREANVIKRKGTAGRGKTGLSALGERIDAFKYDYNQSEHNGTSESAKEGESGKWIF